MQPLQWHNEKRKVRELVGNKFNPRKITPEQKKKLQESIEKFNLVETPVIDTDNTILAGHQRIGVLITLGRGEEEIDVRVPNRKLTEEEVKEYLLRSNISNGSWDDELLQDMGQELLELAGFSEIDIARILGEDPKIPDAKFTKTIAFTSTPEHGEFIRACLELAEQEEDLIQYGKRPRLSDKLLYILNDWGKNKGVVLQQD